MKTNRYRLPAMALATMIAGGTLQAEPAGDHDGKPGPATERAGKPAAADSATAILGTWTNDDYNGRGRSGRVTYSKGPDGALRYVATDMADGSGRKYPGSVLFHKQWTDDKGFRHGVSTVTLDAGFKWRTLSRISPDGKTLEVQSGVEKIDPEGPRYSIYHKQEE